MGIFDKACPQCTADSAAGAIRCACGFIFDTADANGSAPSPKETAEEEKLFEEYLAARVAQAIEQATVATHAADVEPENERRAIEAIRAQETVEKAKRELAAQQERAAKAAEAARKAELIVGAVPIQTKKPVNGSPVAKFGGTEVVEDDRLFKDYLAARKAQAAVQKKTPIQNPAAQAKPTVTTNEQIWPRAKDKWEIKEGIGEGLPLTATEAKRYPEWRRNGHTRTLPKNEIMALYSLRSTSEKQAPKKQAPKKVNGMAKKVNGKNSPPAAISRSRPRRPSVLVPAVKVGLGAAAKTTAKGTKVIGKGIAKLISKTIQATQHHARKDKIPTLHAEVGVKRQSLQPQPSHNAQPKRATVRPNAKAGPSGPRIHPSPSAMQKPAPQARGRAVGAKPNPTPTTKKNGVANRRVDTRLGAGTPSKPAVPSPKMQPKLNRAAPKQTSIPGAAFRATQASKIAKAVESARAMEEPETNRDAFHAAQTKKIEQALSTARLMQTLEAARECPMCTAVLSANATDCRCGWTASADDVDMPGLELTDQERIETVGVPEPMTCPVECPVCTATVPAGVPSCGCGWAVPVGEREMPPLALSPDERSAIAHGEKIKRG